MILKTRLTEVAMKLKTSRPKYSSMTFRLKIEVVEIEVKYE